MASVKIRKARASERDEIKRMDHECFSEDSPLRMYDDDLWWVAVDTSSGELVGYAGAQEWECRQSGKPVERVMYLNRAGVMPSHRGMGIHVKLMRARVAEARRRDMHEVWSLTAHSNTLSMNTFIACGFMTWLPSMWAGWSQPWKPEDGGDTGWVFWYKPLRRKGPR